MMFLFSLVMIKDRRYKIVKNLISCGDIEFFHEIFCYIPKTVVGKDLGIHNQTFHKLLKSPERFTFFQSFRIAVLFEVEEKNIIDLIYQQCIVNRNYQRKNK